MDGRLEEPFGSVWTETRGPTSASVWMDSSLHRADHGKSIRASSTVKNGFVRTFSGRKRQTSEPHVEADDLHIEFVGVSNDSVLLL